MRKNNKGFMLVEVIVTSVVIIVAMVGLYSTFSKLYSRYNEMDNYSSVDGIYATKEMVHYLWQNDFNAFVNSSLDTKLYQFIIKDGTCQVGGVFCNHLQAFYKIENMVFTEYDKCDLVVDSKHNTDFNCKTQEGLFLPITNQTFKDYIDYVVGHYNIENANLVNESDEDEFSYIILTEIYDGKDYYYSNLRIR